MSTPSYADLIVPMTLAKVRETYLAMLRTFGFPVSAWGPVDEPRATVEGASQVLADVSAMGAEIGKLGMIGTSSADGPTGESLTMTGAQMYDEPRKAAAALVGTVTLTETAGTPHTYSAGEVLFASTSDPSLVYRNVSGFTLSALSTLAISIAAESKGAKYNVQGSTLALATPIPGVTLTVAGDTSWAGTAGADEEGDDAYRLRLPTKWGTLTPTGPDAAYLSWALAASSSINRAKVIGDSTAVYPTPMVKVVLAGPAGPVAAAVVSAADTAIQAKRPTGTLVQVVSAGSTSYALKGDITVKAASRSTAEALIASTLTAWFGGSAIAVNGESVAGLQIGDTVRVSQIIEIVMSISGVVSYVPKDGTNTVRVPGSGDVAISATNVAVLTWSPTSWIEV